MNHDDFKLPLAPLGFALLVILVINLFVLLSWRLDCERLDLVLGLPAFLFALAGAALVVVWFPIFLESAYLLAIKGGPGQAGDFQAAGIYKHLRHPLYAGLGLSLLGAGFMANHTGVVLSALALSAVFYWRSLRDDERLLALHGREYEDYCARVPRFLPRFGPLFRDFLSRSDR